MNTVVMAIPLLLVLVGAAQAAERCVIWKFDDLRAGPKGNIAACKEVVEWAASRRMPISFGIITDSLAAATPEDLAWLRQHASANGGGVEFWNHGWDHGKKTSSDGATTTWEFKGTDLETQVKSLTDAQAALLAVIGTPCHAFGAPFNATDATTAAALDATPELTVWMYGPKHDTKRTVLSPSVPLEVKTGKVTYEGFMAHYPGTTAPYLLLQAHPPYWDKDSFAAFVRIAERVTADGWRSVAPTVFAMGGATAVGR